ncbi:MAG TPA: hypothetical protein VNX86_13105 [Rhizomicrobium sp.]|nr:hypothetical protein [Rhizomicrobium sp.]
MFSIASSFRISRAGSQNADPVLPKPAISALVVDPPRFVVVRGTIDLDGQVRQCTVEIQNVGTYRVLPLESQSIQSATANPFPEQRFRQRHLAPQFARAFERQHRCAHLDSLRPTLLGVICIWHIFKRLWAAAPSTAFGGPPPPRFARRRNLRRAR